MKSMAAFKLVFHAVDVMDPKEREQERSLPADATLAPLPAQRCELWSATSHLE
jgi:hypothetical protein